MLKFDINIVWTLFNLILFYVLMRVFLFKPIKRTLDARKQLIDNQFKSAQDKEDSAIALKAQYESQLSGVEDEKKQIIADAKKDAKAQYDKIVAKAGDDAEKIKSDAKKASDIECEKARLAVKEEIAALAMETAAKVVGKEASADTDSELYNKFLNESSDE